ncbi:hypothetical protein FF80_03430 [Devosia sp. LC5]|nr:hypothetical protein FF80_03430 [Devosia sp. LC5]
MLGIMMKSPRRGRLAMIMVGLLCMGLGVALFWGAIS